MDDDLPFVDGVGDDGAWEWDHGRSAVNMGFRLDRDHGVSADVLVTRAVARVLATGEEDHRATWWDSGDTPTNAIIPG
jgi:hypothetical protein